MPASGPKLMRALVISDDVRVKIAAALKAARAKPITMEFLKQFETTNRPDLPLADRPPGFERPPSQFVDIPFGFLAAISFEQQPPGLCRHLSVSVDREGALPSPESVIMIAEEFGFTKPLLESCKVWTEEFEPGHRAVNLVQVVEDTEPGHA